MRASSVARHKAEPSLSVATPGVFSVNGTREESTCSKAIYSPRCKCCGDFRAKTFFPSGVADQRSKARSLHVKKQFDVAWQIIKPRTRHKNNQTKGDTQIPQPDAFRHPADKQSKKRKGQGPTKTTTNKDRLCTQWYKATVSQLKIMQQTNWLPPSKVKHAFLIVAADRQQKNALAVHYCVT